MLKHTKKIKAIYENIQKMLFYLIPEKWDKLYLYSSIIDKENGKQEGELYFYYIPKGIFKKKPVNVYEVPYKFNLEESEYLKLVEVVFGEIKKIREEFKKIECGQIWSNITMSIQNAKFKVEYDYEDLENNNFDSYERHIIWRYKYLGIGLEQLNKKEKEILNRYLNGPKMLVRKEVYETGIYITDIENIIGYNTDKYEPIQNVEYVATKDKKVRKNQILLSEDEIKLKEIQENFNKE